MVSFFMKLKILEDPNQIFFYFPLKKFCPFPTDINIEWPPHPPAQVIWFRGGEKKNHFFVKFFREIDDDLDENFFPLQKVWSFSNNKANFLVVKLNKIRPICQRKYLCGLILQRQIGQQLSFPHFFSTKENDCDVGTANNSYYNMNKVSSNEINKG